MKHLAKFAAMALALSLWSCSDDLPDQQKDGEDGVYATITLHLPNGSRSSTVDPNDKNNGVNKDPNKDPNDPNVPSQSNNGYEIGNANENAVNNLLVVLAVRNGLGNYTYVASGVTSQPENISENRPTYMLRFNASDLIKQAGKELYIFAYCNAPAGVANGIGNDFSIEETFSLPDEKDEDGQSIDGGSVAPDKNGGPIGLPFIAVNNGSKPNFLMTNALKATKTLPSEEEIKSFNKGNPFDLGVVSVERVVSRLDFKQHQSDIAGFGLNEYPVYFNTDETPICKVTLVGMALFNESKSFYVLPRVSNNGLNDISTENGWSLCGYETTKNFVVSTHAREKAAYDGEGSIDLSEYFFYPTMKKNADGTIEGNAPQGFNYTYLNSKDVPVEDDLHETSYGSNYLWSNTVENPDGYKIWRYVTENTIAEYTNQRNGISTGVYFKAKLSEPNTASPVGEALSKAMNANPRKNFYAYSSILATEQRQNNYANVNEIFGDIQATYDYCKAHSETDLAQNFQTLCTNGVFQIYNGNTPVDPAEIYDATKNQDYTASDSKLTSNRNKQLNSLGFYCYYPSSDGSYYCYYPYYIRHNDNGDDFVMVPMEFATVRNNIYKLQVTNISRIGLPGDTPPDPGTPDEADDVYMKVAVQVLDWVVRINNIVY